MGEYYVNFKWPSLESRYQWVNFSIQKFMDVFTDMQLLLYLNFGYRAVSNWVLVSKVIVELLWFCFTPLCYWLKKLAPPAQPIRCKSKTNRDLVTRVFPRLAPVTCIWFLDSREHLKLALELVVFWFYDTRMKTAKYPVYNTGVLMHISKFSTHT